MSMILKGRNGNEFELCFVRDSLPEVQDGLGDDQWARGNCRAASQADSWEESAPCIILFAFETLGRWMDAVGRSADGKPRELVAIPYYSWSHRGPGEMAVWLKRPTAGSAGSR